MLSEKDGSFGKHLRLFPHAECVKMNEPPKTSFGCNPKYYQGVTAESPVLNEISLYSSTAAWAAASLAIGTL